MEPNMRTIILATAFIALSPLAFAQPYSSGGTGSTPGPRTMGSQMAGQPSSENCGTPDEPKPCPPMPRHPLQHYPPDKQ
jgi:hypothetical protein